MKRCTRCDAPVDPLAVFPGGVCLDCWSKDEGAAMPTANEVRTAWGMAPIPGGDAR
jgi:hypothetical protein